MGHPLSLELSFVSCWHGNSTVVRDVSLHAAPGEHVAIIGGNGSGKTTLLRAIVGLHHHARGHIAVDGKVAKSSADWHLRRQRVAYVPQRMQIGQFPLLMSELLASSRNADAAQRAADALGLSALTDRPLSTLSGGQLQRAFLARAMGMLQGQAGMLIADEPTAALDFDGQAAIAELLAGLAATLLVITHDRAVSAKCHRVVEMADGRLRAVTA